MNHTSLIRAPSGYVPLLLAAAATALLVGYLATGPYAPSTVVDGGVVREDEGLTAHLWQLLMLLQLPVILLFAARWLPRDPKRAVPVLALQLLTFAAAALPVFLLEM